MKKDLIIIAALLAAGATKAETTDSVKTVNLQDVVVNGVRAQKNAPYAVANINQEKLETFSKTGQELPFLLAQTPGVIGWGENGLGTGTAHLRIRGAADSRINVTLDGVPLNSPEDQTVFWANMNSYSALMRSVQIQRGIGTSTNGDGAFGGTVSLATLAPSYTPSFELTGSYGSYNTYNTGASFSTGLMGKHLIFDGAYHETATDGYIHGTSGRSGSYYGGLTWIGDNFQIRYKNIGNFEKTGQAWNGVTAGDNDMSLMDYGVKTYKDMYEAGLGKFNNLYEALKYDDKGHFAKDANGNYITERYKMNDGSYWNKTTDNFYQNHNIISAVWQPSEHWSHNIALHYTYGYGYYKEFRPNNKLKKFGLPNFTTSDGETVKKTDFVRKKGLTQNTYGAIYNVNYNDGTWNVTGGINFQQFHGNHFGDLTYIANKEMSEKYLSSGNYKYYDSDAHKYDYSGFFKANYHFNNYWDAFMDIQMRLVEYKTNGINDKFISNGDGTYSNQQLNISEHYNFVNPKAGITYMNNGHKAYVSIAYSNREPERNNFTDNGSYPFPTPERLTDIELGYEYSGNKWHAGVNLYYMYYSNQFVQTGAKSDIGENLTTNVKSSYRMGAEISAGWNPLSWLTVEGNAALSRNRIKNFDESASVDWDDLYRTIHYDNSTLAFSPSTILNGFVNLHYRGAQAIWHTNFVSSQYLDNTQNSDRSLPCYSQTDINLNYTFKVSKKIVGMKEIIIGANFNNIFDRHYASSGWVYSSIIDSANHPNENRYYQIGFVPNAGFTAMGYLTLKF